MFMCVTVCMYLNFVCVYVCVCVCACVCVFVCVCMHSSFFIKYSYMLVIF